MALTEEESRRLQEYRQALNTAEALFQNLRATDNPTKDQHGMMVVALANIVPKLVPVVDLLLKRTGLVETGEDLNSLN